MKKLTLSLIASAALAAQLVTSPQASAATTKTCTPTQSVEEGPYYLANSPVRSNVTDGQAGKAITLNFTILDTACKPIKGARVDIWYANAQGIYSGVASRGDDLGAGVNSGNFLRGTQTTNAKGVATFKGIYPGWYPARTIHIHQKIWVGGKEVLTTQTFFTDKQNAAVMALAPYNARGAQRITNSNDMVLNRGNVDLNSLLMKLVGTKASSVIVVKP
jgi:protocatechuate 3,4-dioxygenase beta subunit